MTGADSELHHILAVALATGVVQLVAALIDRFIVTPRKLRQFAEAAADKAVEKHERQCPGRMLVTPVAVDPGPGFPYPRG